MPVNPHHIHADIPHPKTVMEAGWTYGCHSAKTGVSPRGGRGTSMVQDGWRSVVIGRSGRIGTMDQVKVIRPHSTEWLTTNHEGKTMWCGHLSRMTDAQCEGCANRRDD